jgi:hypothetical protein
MQVGLSPSADPVTNQLPSLLLDSAANSKSGAIVVTMVGAGFCPVGQRSRNNARQWGAVYGAKTLSAQMHLWRLV